MSILYLVLPLALVIVGAAVVAFSWAARRGQFDDLETPALRMLHDDDEGSGTRRDAPGGKTPP
ncbi:MAG TPA: cbb3-type cytochrome oxidase assembly protein CcoS [Gemmatimonadaceae bacterium]|nr:cbb3-type cytochrome oxidase assembly protein CcoS [Gemmatimonadaceae bacterium]